MPGTEFSKAETGPAGLERSAESPEAASAFEASKAKENVAEAAAVPAPAPVSNAQMPAAPAKDPIRARVESVMEEDLKDTYLAMPENLRRRFKLQGEKVAVQVAEMIKKLKVQAEKVLSLIRDWLKLIPGVNKFFLI